jgi:hypothetical protein
MRIFTALGLLVLAAAPAEAATRNFGVSGFDRIRVDGPYKVRVSTGVAPFAIAEGSQTALDGMAIDVQGRTLIVRNNRQTWGGYPGEGRGPVEIRIGTHDLGTAWVNGSGTLTIDQVRGLSFDLSVQGSGSVAIESVKVDQFKLGIAGSGSVSLAGEALKLTAIVRGISQLDASRLKVKDATIGAEGPSTVKADVSGDVKIDAQGTTAIELAGGPTCEVRAGGSVSLSGCR